MRTKQKLFNSNLLTEEDAQSADFFKDLQELGATEKDYQRIEENLRKRWGSKPKSDDVVWGVSNYLIMNPPISADDYNPQISRLQHAKQVSFVQALYLVKKGKDPTACLRDSRNLDVKISQLQDIGITHLVIETNGCCKNCSKYQGEKYSLEQLETSPILPIKGCTHKLSPESKYSWCTCCYSPDTSVWLNK